MNHSDLELFLKSAIRAKHCILVQGSPGIGKTHIVEQACKAEGAELFYFYVSISDPTDLKGFGMLVDGKAEFVPFGELRRVYEAIAAGKRVVLFFDDLGQGAPATQASAMSLMDKLKGQCAIFAATNRKEDRAGVQGILEPVKSRFHAIVSLEPDLNEFCNHLLEAGEQRYGLSEDAILDGVSFLRFRPDLLCAFTPTVEISNSPCPRTWVAALQQVTLNLPGSIEFEALQGAIGKGPGGEFAGFKKMRRALPNLDGILLDPSKVALPTEASIRWAVCTGLAAKATEANFPRVHQFAQRLLDNGQAQFAALLIRDCTRRTPAIMETAEFQKVCGGPIGDLITGNYK